MSGRRGIRRSRRGRRAGDLTAPRAGRTLSPHFDTEAFGRFSETVARLIGTARFLLWQTVVVVVWIVLNVAFPSLRFDEYPFILLTLALSMQASYAAPLILLAQNRQEERDRMQSESDRATRARNLAETEFVARELASIRLALADVVTNDDLDRALERLRTSQKDHSDPKTEQVEERPKDA